MGRQHRKINRRAWERIRLVALDRDGWRCQVCGRAGRLEVDHRIPLHKGGEALDLDNLQTLCAGCHVAKTRGENEKGPEKGQWRALLRDLRRS